MRLPHPHPGRALALTCLLALLSIATTARAGNTELPVVVDQPAPDAGGRGQPPGRPGIADHRREHGRPRRERASRTECRRRLRRRRRRVREAMEVQAGHSRRHADPGEDPRARALCRDGPASAAVLQPASKAKLGLQRHPLPDPHQRHQGRAPAPQRPGACAQKPHLRRNQRSNPSKSVLPVAPACRATARAISRCLSVTCRRCRARTLLRCCSSRPASCSQTRVAQGTPSRCSCAASTPARARISSSRSTACRSTRAVTCTGTATPIRTSSSPSWSSP